MRLFLMVQPSAARQVVQIRRQFDFEEAPLRRILRLFPAHLDLAGSRRITTYHIHVKSLRTIGCGHVDEYGCARTHTKN
jgi:hypothetical protein